MYLHQPVVEFGPYYRVDQQSTAFPLPSTPSGLTALKATAPLLVGVP